MRECFSLSGFVKENVLVILVHCYLVLEMRCGLNSTKRRSLASR